MTELAIYLGSNVQGAYRYVANLLFRIVLWVVEPNAANWVHATNYE